MSALRLMLPIVFGVAAAILNFLVLRGSTTPLELTAIRADVKADTELTEDMLEPLPIRADESVFKSAVPYKQRGVALLNRRVTRPLNAGEVLLFTDVHNLDEENLSLYLKPGESTLTVYVQPMRIARSLQRGDSVGFLVAVQTLDEPLKSLLKTPSTPAMGRRMLGPFRLLSLGPIVDPTRTPAAHDMRMVTVAMTRPADGRLAPDVAALDEALSAPTPGGPERGVLAVERYMPAK